MNMTQNFWQGNSVEYLIPVQLEIQECQFICEREGKGSSLDHPVTLFKGFPFRIKI